MADFETRARSTAIKPAPRRGWSQWLLMLVTLYAVACLAILAGLVMSHWRFPLFLETMEGAVLQHALRAADGLWIYPNPTPDFTALAYTPLYYVVSAPLMWIFGPELTVLRIVASAGYALAIWLTYAVVRDRGEESTQDWRIGLIAAGLFAAAYQVMDAYLDTAHSDSWMIASALLGTWIIDKAYAPRHIVFGVAVLCAAFWFKQHGALFALGGVAFVTWRHGVRASMPAWITAILFGPALYAVSPLLFGPATHLFTYTVPSSWSVINLRGIGRLSGFALTSYPLLAAASLYEYSAIWRTRFASLTIWHVQGIAALASGVLATFDTGGARNTFIPLGVFVIILGSLGAARLSRDAAFVTWGRTLGVAVLALSFVPLAYNPRRYLTDQTAPLHYQKLISLLRDLDGPVASLSLGQLPADFRLSPAVLWVAIDDLERGRKARPENIQTAAALIAAVTSRPAPHYVLSNEPLDDTPLTRRLFPHYELLRDYETQFTSLAGLPGTYPTRHSYPRFLYQRRAASSPLREAKP
jgi:hypothetical protein